MNSHFQPYSELSTSHSPSPESSVCYTNLSETNGGGSGSGGGNASGGISASTNLSTGNGSNGNGNAGGNNGIGERISGNSSSISCNGSNMVVHHQNGHSLSLNGGVGGGVGGGGGGTGGGGGGDGNSTGNPCVGNGTRNNQPGFHQLNSNNNCAVKQCSGCGGKIIERYFLHALDRYWHNSCLKCYCCGAMLADIGSSCYTRGGMILCKPDYSRMFGTAPCSACGQTIAPNEFVMRTTSPISSQQKQQQQQQQQQQHQHQQQQQNQHPIQTGHSQAPPGVGGVENQRHFQTHQNLLTHPQHQHHIPVEHHVFHLKCFACSKCASQLRPGDRYYMLGGSLVCEQDWHKLLKTTSTNPPVRKGKVGRPRRSKD